MAFGVLALAGLLTAAVVGPTVGAACSGPGCVGQAVNDLNPGTNTDLPTLIKKIINLLLYVIGAVSVIMIVVGAIKYTVSNGDSNAMTSAKNTIFYAVIGLVVAIAGYAIVNFVVTYFT